jgi:hypothetical protein
MSKPAFILPAGLEIDVGEVLSIGYEGDVVLEQSFGRTLGDIYAGGDLTIRLDTVTGSLRAGGKLIVEGKIDADTLHAREVILGKQDIKCRAISADERIVIGAAKLAVDIIIAPEIVLDPKANGRVTVIEALHEPGPTKIKGGFSLKEYEEVVGDPTQFLAERGITPLSGERSSPAAEEEEPDVDAPRAPAARTPTAPVPTNASPSIPHEEDISDPLSLSVDDLEPLAEAQEDADELHPKLMDAVKRIAACYEGKEVPPAVNQLKELVESRDYDRLRENITEVWNGLLGFHQKKGIRPHHQVTHAFNVIHGLVQQG